MKATFAIVFALAAIACGLAITGDAAPPDGPLDASANDGGAPPSTSIDGDAPLPDEDAGPSVCPWPSLERGAVWPMLGGCVEHAGRTIFNGPHVKPVIAFGAPVKRVYRTIPVSGVDGAILVGADTEGVIRVDPSDGGTSLFIDAGGNEFNVTNAPAIGRDGRLYYGGGKNVIAFGRGPNQGGWRFDTTQEVDTSPALTKEGTVIAGSLNDHLYAFDKNDGGKLWEIDLKSDVEASPAISPSTGNIYTCSGNHCFSILEKDGGMEWDYNAGTSVGLSTPVLGMDGAILIMTSSGELRSLRPDGKTVTWTYKTNSGGPSLIHLAASVALDGTVYTGMNRILSALNPNDGIPRWELDVGGSIRTSVLIDGSGVLFVGTDAGAIVAVSPIGGEIWRLPMPVACNPEGLLIGRDGTLYVLCQTTNFLHALR